MKTLIVIGLVVTIVISSLLTFFYFSTGMRELPEGWKKFLEVDNNNGRLLMYTKGNGWGGGKAYVVCEDGRIGMSLPKDESFKVTYAGEYPSEKVESLKINLGKQSLEFYEYNDDPYVYDDEFWETFQYFGNQSSPKKRLNSLQFKKIKQLLPGYDKWWLYPNPDYDEFLKNLLNLRVHVIVEGSEAYKNYSEYGKFAYKFKNIIYGEPTTYPINNLIPEWPLLNYINLTKMVNDFGEESIRIYGKDFDFPERLILKLTNMGYDTRIIHSELQRLATGFFVQDNRIFYVDVTYDPDSISGFATLATDWPIYFPFTAQQLIEKKGIVVDISNLEKNVDFFSYLFWRHRIYCSENETAITCILISTSPYSVQPSKFCKSNFGVQYITAK